MRLRQYCSGCDEHDDVACHGDAPPPGAIGLLTYVQLFILLVPVRTEVLSICLVLIQEWALV